MDLFSSYNKLVFEKEWSNSSILFKQEFIDSFTNKIHFKTRKQINDEHININHIDFLTKNKVKFLKIMSEKRFKNLKIYQILNKHGLFILQKSLSY